MNGMTKVTVRLPDADLEKLNKIFVHGTLAWKLRMALSSYLSDNE